jgi:nucleoside-diphosphate-sugar epimerase
MKNYNISELAKKVVEICPGSEVELVDIKFEDARNYRVSSEKIKDAGWAPSYSLEDGIKEIVDTIKQNRIKNVNNSIYSNVAYLKELNKNAQRI